VKIKLGHEALLLLNSITQALPKKLPDKPMASKYTTETSEFEWLKKKVNPVLNAIVMEEIEVEAVVEEEDVVVDVEEAEGAEDDTTTDEVVIEKETMGTITDSLHMVEVVVVTADTVVVVMVIVVATKIMVLRIKAMAIKVGPIINITQLITTPTASKPNSNTIHNNLTDSSSKVTNLLKINITPHNSNNKVTVKQIQLSLPQQDTVNPQQAKHINNHPDNNNNINPNIQQIINNPSSNTIPLNLINNLLHKPQQRAISNNNHHQLHTHQLNLRMGWHHQFLQVQIKPEEMNSFGGNWSFGINKQF